MYKGFCKSRKDYTKDFSSIVLVTPTKFRVTSVGLCFLDFPQKRFGVNPCFINLSRSDFFPGIVLFHRGQNVKKFPDQRGHGLLPVTTSQWFPEIRNTKKGLQQTVKVAGVAYVVKSIWQPLFYNYHSLDRR